MVDDSVTGWGAPLPYVTGAIAPLPCLNEKVSRLDGRAWRLSVQAIHSPIANQRTSPGGYIIRRQSSAAPGFPAGIGSLNCASSVLPLSAPVDPCPPVTVFNTRSK